MRCAALFPYLAGLLAAALAAPNVAQAAEVDLELVLAVDVSRSMDTDELQVQRNGYIAAFRHPDVIAAIRSGPLGRIAVTYIEWSGSEIQMTVVPWTLIDDENTAQGFAARLSASVLRPYAGTSISGGLMFAAASLDKNEFTSARQVIDISGDGPNNRGLPVETVRSKVSASGITINGLPILVKAPFGPYSIPNLDVYYEDCVIGGPGAFLITVHAISQLAVAIRRKLLLEVAGLPSRVLKASETTPVPRIDCRIGEKLIRR